MTELLQAPPGSTTYIFLDTCAIVDCAFSRSQKANPSLLETIVERCKREGVKLLIPEVVLLELDKAAHAEMDSAREAIGKIAKHVEESSKRGVLGANISKSLKSGVAKAKEDLANEVDRAIACVKNASENQDVSVVIQLADEDFIAATRMALAGEKPAKRKTEYGLLQGDCLIVAALQRFMAEHDADILHVCSGNKSDFAESRKDGLHLHPDIMKRLPGASYCSDPVDLLKDVLPAKNEKEQAQTNRLSQDYRLSSAPSAAGASESLAAMVAGMQSAVDNVKLRELGTSVYYPELAKLTDFARLNYPAYDALFDSVRSIQESMKLNDISRSASLSALAFALGSLNNIDRLSRSESDFDELDEDNKVDKDDEDDDGEGE